MVAGRYVRSDADFVPSLGDLVKAAIDRGANITDLAEAAGVNRSWIYQMRDDKVKAFPDTENIEPFAKVLGVRVETLLLAYAKSIGLPLQQGGSRLAALLPVEAARLNERQVEALVQVIRTMAPEVPAEIHTPTPIRRGPRQTESRVARAAKSGASVGRRVREQQDRDAETPDA